MSRIVIDARGAFFLDALTADGTTVAVYDDTNHGAALTLPASLDGGRTLWVTDGYSAVDATFTSGSWQRTDRLSFVNSTDIAVQLNSADVDQPGAATALPSTPFGRGLLTLTDADAARDQMGVAFDDIARYEGVDPTGTTECAAAINAALTAIAAAGRRAYGKGTFKIASTVTIAANCDLDDATFNYTGTSGTAVVVGSATSGTVVARLSARLPRVVSTIHTLGGGWTAGMIGVDICNVQSSSQISVPYVWGFETNLRCYGKGAGCVYNMITIGKLHNGKINHLLDASSTGWTNENLFLSGQFSHDSGEGTGVSGVRHIKTAVCTNPINNNVWLKPSVEGNTPEFHLSVGGQYNRFIQGRYEATTPKVQWDSDAQRSLIDGGYKAWNITESFVSGATGTTNCIRNTDSNRFVSGASPLIVENSSSGANPATTIMDAGAHAAGSDPATAYAVAQGAGYTRIKRSTDTYDRVIIDHSNGRIYFGTGAVAPDAYFRGSSGTLIAVGSLVWTTDNTYDLGSASGPYRPRDLALGRNAIIGGALDHDGTTVGFYGTTPAAKPTVSGAKGSNAALGSLITALANLGLITDSTTT